ncbi:MAG: outer membrane beta-barrel protein [Spirochaetia bacterium]
MRMMTAKRFILYVLILVLGFPPFLYGQAEVIRAAEVTRPWVAVSLPQTAAGDTGGEVLAGILADTIELTLQLLGRYEVRPRPSLPNEAMDESSAALIAERKQLDYLVYGRVERRANGSTLFALSVYSRETEEVTLEQERVADSVFDTFEEAEMLAADLLGAFTGQRIAYGSLSLTNLADNPGDYLVRMDGVPVGRNTRVLEQVLVGPRKVEIVSLEGESAGNTIALVRTTITEGAQEELAFSLSARLEPPEPEREEPDETTETEEAAEPERTAEHVTEPEHETELPEVSVTEEPEEAAQTQEEEEPSGTREFTVGIRGGAAIGRVQVVDGDDRDENTFFYDGNFLDPGTFDIYPRPLVGVFAELQFTQNLYLQTEFGARQLKFHETHEDEISHEIYYSKIPVLLKPKIKTGLGNISFLAGFSYNILWMDKSRESGGLIAQGDEADVITSYDINKTSFSPVLGVEYGISRGRHNFFADARVSNLVLLEYEYINETEGISFPSEIEALDYGASLGYGYNFGGIGDISSKREELDENRWLFPVGIGGFTNRFEKIHVMSLWGVLYRFTDTLYGGVTAGIDSDRGGGALLTCAWAKDPDKLINSFSFLVIPGGSNGLFIGTFYNIAVNRYYIGPLAFFNTSGEHLTQAGLFLGYYF